MNCVQVQEVLEAAEYFQIQELKELCGSVMAAKVNTTWHISGSEKVPDPDPQHCF